MKPANAHPNTVPARRELRPAGATPGTQVYAVGALGFDFGTLRRREAFIAANRGRPIVTNADLAGFLATSPLPAVDFEAVVWTLTLDGAPVYALCTSLERAAEVAALRQRLLDILTDPSADRVAVPGMIVGDTTLLDGTNVALLAPDVGGMLVWSGKTLAAAVGLTAGLELPPSFVNLSAEPAAPSPADWCAWAPAARKQTGNNLIGALTPNGPGGVGLLTPYAGSTVHATWNGDDGTSAPPGAGLAGGGVCASAAAGGVQLTVPADTTPRTLRLYARAFASRVRLVVTAGDGSSPVHVDTAFDAFAPVAGQPGVVDGVYTVVYRTGAPAALRVQLIGTPATGLAPNPQSVTLFAETNGTGATQQVPVGTYPAASLTAAIKNVGSAYIPPGLRLTVYDTDVLGAAAPGAPVVGTAFPATGPGTPFTVFPAGLQNTTHSLVVEPENYVGVQAASLQLAPAAGAPLIPLDAPVLVDVLDRLLYLVRNDGRSPADRAVNYAVTQLLTTAATPHDALAAAIAAGVGIEAVSAEPAPASRAGSDCWDVKLTFFDPRLVTSGRRTHTRLTVDVACSRPATVAPPRTWTSHDAAPRPEDA